MSILKSVTRIRPYGVGASCVAKGMQDCRPRFTHTVLCTPLPLYRLRVATAMPTQNQQYNQGAQFQSGRAQKRGLRVDWKLSCRTPHAVWSISAKGSLFFAVRSKMRQAYVDPNNNTLSIGRTKTYSRDNDNASTSLSTTAL